MYYKMHNEKLLVDSIISIKFYKYFKINPLF